MGKASREKKNRTPAPHTRPSLWRYLPDGPTLLFCVAIFTLAYGTAATQYSRWNQAENRLVHPVFHPWAIVVGLVLLVISIKITHKR